MGRTNTDSSTGAIHTLVIDGWQPAPVNKLLGVHWSKRSRIKKADYDTVFVEARSQDIPKATGKRRVSLEVTLEPRQHRCFDDDGLRKVLLDALVYAKLLIDDSPKWCEWRGQVEFFRGAAKQTVITLEDV